MKSLQHAVKYRNYDWLYCIAIITLFRLESEFELEKLKQEQTIQHNEKFATYNKWLQSIRSRWHFQRSTSIISNFRLFITVTTNQERQSNWKSLRSLLKLLCRMNFRNSSHTKMIRSFQFHCKAWNRISSTKNHLTTWVKLFQWSKHHESATRSRRR